MLKYLSKVLYVLTGKRKSLALLFVIVLLTSALEAIGIGLIGPFLSVASNPDSIQQISLLSWIYQQLALRSNHQIIPILGLAIIIVFCVKSVAYFLAQAYIYRFSYGQKEVLVQRLMKNYLKVEYTFHLSRNTASIIKNVVFEVRNFTSGCLLPLLKGGSNFIIIVILLLLLAKTNILLLVLILAVLLPTVLLFQRLGNKFKKWGRIRSESNQEMIRVINHGLGGLKETRVIGCESYFEEQMADQAHQFSRSATLFQTFQTLPRILIETTLVVFLVSFISLSIIYARQDMQDLTSVMGVFAIAAMRLIPSASQLIQATSQLRNNSYVLDMLYLDLKEIEKQELAKEKGVLPTDREGGLLRAKTLVGRGMSFENKIGLVNVTYRYPTTSAPALDNICLQIQKGESVAFIGKSGAGKTTLVDVILGLLPAESGDIQVDGVSIYENIRSWQNLIGYIPQSIFLIDDTIEKNIAFGVPDELIDPERLHQAIKAAQLEELIEQLPHGIQTRVGERGIRLSGGQRQRVGIARVLYHEREILVLDEATAALDNETENLVTQAINALSGTKTLIVIAHRLSTVEHCDCVYVLERGKIVKSGTYREVVLET
ncbi:MAG: ABC transporter ATP-binding protein/permease [Coleofasciculus sp. C1-SOL-03]|uniref:ABC transporter ATP-binding protein n=1 Tax=Coleofasciculus sp. C1-SOL-03 TaxID=3069522 RepID=UPI0033042D61